LLVLQRAKLELEFPDVRHVTVGPIEGSISLSCT
jgi:hypothetical protein